MHLHCRLCALPVSRKGSLPAAQVLANPLAWYLAGEGGAAEAGGAVTRALRPGLWLCPGALGWLAFFTAVASTAMLRAWQYSLGLVQMQYRQTWYSPGFEPGFDARKFTPV